MAAWGTLTIVAAVFWIGTLAQCWGVARAWTTGPTGSLAVVKCEESHRRKDPVLWFTKGWDCGGVFTTAHGERLGYVTTFVYADERPGPTVDGRVSGTDSDQMWASDDIPDLVALLALAVGLPFGVRWMFWETVDELAPTPGVGWPKPPKPHRDPTKPPQLGARSRKRRRKRAKSAPPAGRPAHE